MRNATKIFARNPFLTACAVDLPKEIEKLIQASQTTLVQVPSPAPQIDLLKREPNADFTLGGKDKDLWAMTYTPYGGDGKGQTWCKKPDEIATAIAAIAKKGFKTIRMYSTDDCEQLPAVHSACKKLKLNLIVGVFFKDVHTCEADLGSQLKIITSHFGGKYDDVELITVGNECISAGSCRADQLAGLVASAKETLRGAGYKGPVSTALIVSDWLENKAALCPVVDVVAAQIHGFFSEQPVLPTAAGSYFENQFEQAKGACGNKPTICSETGWPRQGGSYKAQVAGYGQQKAAIASIRKNKYVGKTTFFANSDDLWKFNQEAYEMYFGCLDQF